MKRRDPLVTNRSGCDPLEANRSGCDPLEANRCSLTDETRLNISRHTNSND